MSPTDRRTTRPQCRRAPAPPCCTAPATCARPNSTCPPSATTTSWCGSPRSASAARTCTTTPPAATGQNVLRQPTVLGHEASGVVVAAGPAARVAVGTRVAVEPARRLRPLRDLPAGGYNVCPTGTCFGSPPTHGTMTQYLVAPDRAAHPLPDSIDTVIGSMIEPLAVAVWAVQRAQVGLGHRVLVTGAGPIGLLVAQVARAAGATEVIVTDVNDDRLAVAAELGATADDQHRHRPAGRRPLLRPGYRVHRASRRAVVDASGPSARTAGSPSSGRPRPSVDGLPLATCSATRSTWSPPSATPTPSRRRSRWSRRAPSTSTGSSPAGSPSTRPPRPSRHPSTDPRHLKVVVTP